ncbi:hypothetical protein SAMN04487926_1169 [Paraburkholderia steynii]|uniref:Uncharacterized protein n=1 Tax=Paraburkholderia steynii TaxID=1245441 RepID=A0A7Z7FK95_9BURK|nr:hypothetical protein [Paraburkholderia steynii]SDI38386.1 hypothetical protein SAMN04487926_1169 [Paraburkholderia steynii]
MERLGNLIVIGAVLCGAGHALADPITYTGYVLSDVTLGGHYYSGAQVYISLESDTTTALPFSDSTGSGYRNEVGRGRVRIVAGRHIITARFEPNQIYAFFDVAHSSIGFGSYLTAGRTYPLAVTAMDDQDGLVTNSSVGAVSDIMTTPANAANYTQDTATLTTNLANETALSGAVSSVPSIALRTDRGDFVLYEPYTVNYGSGPYSVNWGFFWATLGKGNHEEDNDIGTLTEE